jgi:hypothetical protein
MARARVVAPPPQDYIPESLVSAPPPPEEVVVEEWIDGNLQEEIIEVASNEPSEEELEKERLAQEKHEELQRQKLFVEEESKVAAETIAKAKEILDNPPVVIEKVIETVIETVHVTDPKLIEELQTLKEENEKLAREKDAVEKAREDQIVKMRQLATEQKVSHQLNIVKPSKPSIKNRIKDFFRKRRIERATISVTNYEHAIIHQASVAVPKMLDEIEKMHESLTILEELLAKHNEREKINRSEKHPRR